MTIAQPAVLVRFGGLLVSVFFTACGGSPSDASTPTLTSLRVVGGGSVEVGSTAKLAAMAQLSDGTAQDISGAVVWTASDPAVAIIDQNGSLTGYGQGSTDVTISEHVSGMTASATLTVVNGEVTLQSLRLSSAQLVLGVSFSRKLRASAVFSNGLNVDMTESVSWSSSNPSIASVSDSPGSKGAIAGGLAGATSVQAVHGPSQTTASAEVTVTDENSVALVSLALTPGSVATRVSATTDLAVNATFADATVRDVTAQVDLVSSDVSIVAIDPVHPGRIIALREGSATVTASAGTISAAPVTVTVAATAFDDLTLSANTTSIFETDVVAITAIAHSGAETLDVTSYVAWTSSNPALAQVDNLLGTKGTLTAVKTGAVTITAALPDGGLTATLGITVQTLVLENLASAETAVRIAPGETHTLEVLGTFNSGVTRSVVADLTWTTSDTRIATVVNGVLTAPVDAATWAAITRGTATITGTYAGTSQQVAVSVTKGEYTAITINGGAERILQTNAARDAVVTLQRDIVSVVGDGTPFYTLTTQTADELERVTFTGSTVNNYDALTTASVLYQTATATFGVSSALAVTAASPIGGTVAVRKLGAVLEPSQVEVTAEACTVDPSTGGCTAAPHSMLHTQTTALRLPDSGSQAAPLLLTSGFASYQAPAGAAAHFIVPIPESGIGRDWEIGVRSAESVTIEVFADDSYTTALVLNEPEIPQANVTAKVFKPTGRRAAVRITLPQTASTRQFVLTADYKNDIGLSLDIDTPLAAQVGGLPYGNRSAETPDESPAIGDFSAYFGFFAPAKTYQFSLSGVSSIPLVIGMQICAANGQGCQGEVDLDDGIDGLCAPSQFVLDGNPVTCTIKLKDPSQVPEGMIGLAYVTVIGGFTPDAFGATYVLELEEIN